MRNYGFDYLVKKVQVLNEMAPKSKFWNSNFPEFMDLYLDVQNKMKQHPKAPSGPTLGHRRIEYITRMLFNFLSKDELAAIGIDKNAGFGANVRNLTIRDIPHEERMERGIKNSTEITPEYAKFAPVNSRASFLQQDFMLAKMALAYPEKAMSKKFVNKVMDDANIDAFLNDNPLKTGSSNFAYGTIKKKEEILKMDMGDVNEILNKAKAIIKKLRKSKKLPRGLRTSIYHADIEKIGEKPTEFNTKNKLYPLFVMQTTLEQFLEIKLKIIQDIRNKEEITPEGERLFKFDRTILSNLLDTVNKRIDEKKPLEVDKIYKNIIEKMTGISDLVRREYDALYKELQSNPMDALKDRYDTVFDMLDDELLDNLEREGTINSEDREILKKWASISGNLQKNIQTRGERILRKNIQKGEQAKHAEDAKKKYEDRGKKWAAKEKPNIDIKDEVEGLTASEIEEKLREMMLDPDADIEKIDAMSEYLSKLQADGPEDEEGVMGYMTEQVNKDRHLNNIGEYKDRGFKKPKNYAHWLWMNEQ